MSEREFVSPLVKFQDTKLSLCWKDIILQLFFKCFISIFSNFLRVPVFLEHTSEWLLPVCGKCTSQESCVKIYVKESSLFLVVFVFLGDPFCTTFYFQFLKLRIAPSMLKIILNILFLFLCHLKTQISFYILIDDSAKDFWKCFIFCYIVLIFLIVLRQK